MAVEVGVLEFLLLVTTFNSVLFLLTGNKQKEALFGSLIFSCSFIYFSEIIVSNNILIRKITVNL